MYKNSEKIYSILIFTNRILESINIIQIVKFISLF